MKIQLNARRLLCPLPVIRTQDAIKNLQTGDEIEVICTDLGVLQDIPLWCRLNGHEVIETRTENFDYIVVVKVCHG